MRQDAFLSFFRQRPELKAKVRHLLGSVGYDTTDWVRVVMYQRSFDFIRQLGPDKLDALEISAGPIWQREFQFKSFTGTQYPGFDICAGVLERKFDLIIADQVFEHLTHPLEAARNVLAMLKPGGYAIISTPFLLRVHNSPIDCSRWTETGLSLLLEQAGFQTAEIKTGSWGNRACLKANLTKWRKRGFFGSLRNEPDFPVMVWAFARKPTAADWSAG
ncbi:hypothetical protein N825_21870 [Skermanella stibiiresistens SB22]|uniref:Type 12 methyltransferase n=1 Tax=Skermanella stibiiresistens SB22 TaxID=1385369 RepID=W9GXB3_9PROT|nr:hypothetical protein N825_21870 [Skermanella stibiiresistens SB22]